MTWVVWIHFAKQTNKKQNIRCLLNSCQSKPAHMGFPQDNNDCSVISNNLDKDCECLPRKPLLLQSICVELPLVWLPQEKGVSFANVLMGTKGWLVKLPLIPVEGTPVNMAAPTVKHLNILSYLPSLLQNSPQINWIIKMTRRQSLGEEEAGLQGLREKEGRHPTILPAFIPIVK